MAGSQENKDEVVELSEEEVFSNDIDPIDAIREIRAAEGIKDEDLIIGDEETSDSEDQPSNGDDELDNLAGGEEDDVADADDEPGTDDIDAGEEDADPANDDDEDDTQDEDQGEADGSKDEKPAAKIKTFKANGQEFEFTEEEVMEQFETVFGKAMNYTQKMQDIAPYRKMISALETENITSEQLNLAIDALKGDKGALKQLLDVNKIDAFDLGDEDNEGKDPYVANDYGKNDVQLGIDEVAKSISGDEEYKITVDVIDNQWDQTSRESFASNPQLISGLHSDIKTGMYDKVAPVAMKMKVLDGNTKSDIEYYMLAGEKVLTAEKQTSENLEKTVADKNKAAQDAENDFDQASSEAKKKRAAANTRKRADRKGVTDYLDDDDEKFDVWYKNLEASS